MTTEELEWSDYGRDHGAHVLVMWVALCGLCVGFCIGCIWVAITFGRALWASL